MHKNNHDTNKNPKSLTAHYSALFTCASCALNTWVGFQKQWAGLNVLEVHRQELNTVEMFSN